MALVMSQTYSFFPLRFLFLLFNYRLIRTQKNRWASKENSLTDAILSGNSGDELFMADTDESNTEQNDKWIAEFELNTDVDSALIEFLENSDDMNKQIVNMLNLGKSVYLAATFSTSGDTLRELMKPLDDRITSLTETIESFQGKSKISTVIGTMGEDIAKNQFKSRFNSYGDGFEIDSNRGHQGDILGSMKIVTDANSFDVPVLIEAKEYADPPGSKEIKKFWKDLEENKPNYGMMISFKHKIATKEAAIDIESRGGKVAFFISNDSHDDLRHIIAWEMLRLIVKSDITSGYTGSGISKEVENLIKNLNNEITELEKGLDHLGMIKRTAESIISTAGTHSQELYQSYSEIKSVINSTVTRMKQLVIDAGDEYANAVQKMISWKDDVLGDAFKEYNNKQKHLISIIENPLLNNTENYDIEKSDDGKLVTFSSKLFEDRNVRFEAQKTNLVLYLNVPINEEITKSLGGKVVKGEYKFSISPSADTYAKFPFEDVRKSLQLLFS
tara:strand:+ start:397 stop:1902 length:1506 start_codon:yes stop_codon:yes gene_type:complete